MSKKFYEKRFKMKKCLSNYSYLFADSKIQFILSGPSTIELRIIQRLDTLIQKHLPRILLPKSGIITLPNLVAQLVELNGTRHPSTPSELRCGARRGGRCLKVRIDKVLLFVSGHIVGALRKRDDNVATTRMPRVVRVVSHSAGAAHQENVIDALEDTQ